MVNIPGVGKLIRRGIVAAPTVQGNLVHELKGRFAQKGKDPELVSGDDLARMVDAIPFTEQDEADKGDGQGWNKQRRK